MFRSVIILILCFCSMKIVAVESCPLEDLTIVVSSCDKYQEFWDPFFKCFFKNWSSLRSENQHVPVILITNHSSYSNPRVMVVQTGDDESWSANMQKVLEKVNTRYVLYLQEDYFLTAPVDDQRFKHLLDLMKKEQLAYLQLGQDRFFDNEKVYPKDKDLVVKSRFIRYRTSLQAALWKKDIFLRLLNPKENPWEFEILGSTRSAGVEEAFMALQKNHPIQYLNACGAGHWNSAALDYLRVQGIDVQVTLPVDKDHRLKLWMLNHHPKSYKRLSWLLNRL